MTETPETPSNPQTKQNSCWNLQLERGNQLQFTSTDQMSTWNKPAWVQIDEKFLQSGFSHQHTHTQATTDCIDYVGVLNVHSSLAATSKPVSSVET